MDASYGEGANVRILANPGTGKTEAIANEVISLISKGVKPSEILCITFTNKAAAEMRERILKKASDSGIDFPADELIVDTFHGYAFGYLQDNDRDYKIVSNRFLRYTIFKYLMEANALNYSREYILEEFVPKMENAIRYIKSFGILPDAIEGAAAERALAELHSEMDEAGLAEHVQFLRYFLDAFNAYENAKPEGMIDYNDMLILFKRKYDKRKRHYRHVLVDETQDVNELEADIATMSGDRIFAVGDRKQSIFGFQGGNFANFSRFGGEDAKEEKLKLNYRSKDEILEYAKAYFLSKVSNREGYEPELKGLEGKRGTGGIVKVLCSDSQDEACVFKAAGLLGALKEGERVAIITRSRGQLLSISRLLDEHGIRYSSTSGSFASGRARSEIASFLRGLISTDANDIRMALYTPFSGLTLREAFEIAGGLKSREAEFSQKRFSGGFGRFEELRKKATRMDTLIGLMDSCVIPISISMGRDYFEAAKSIKKSMEELAGFPSAVSSVEDFIDYIVAGEDEQEPAAGEKLVVTTVHKAKGLEFENVIYAPHEPRETLSLVDMAVYSIMKACRGIDIREELREEKLRVDFVALTRARNCLYVIANKKNASQYKAGKVDVEDIDSGAYLHGHGATRAERAYSLFASGRREEAAVVLEARERWLEGTVKNYFHGVDKLSYSMVNTVSDSYEFMKRYVLGLNESGPAAARGSHVHKIAERLFKGNLNPEDLKGEDLLHVNNIKAIFRELEEKYGAVQVDAELRLSTETAKLSQAVHENIQFVGVIDALFRCSDGKLLILDYKTDRDTSRASEHRRQLEVYRTLYAASRGVGSGDIRVGIAYISLRGRVNTGVIGYGLDDAQPRKGQFTTFERALAKFLAYRENPQRFIDDFLAYGADDLLGRMLSAELG